MFGDRTGPTWDYYRMAEEENSAPRRREREREQEDDEEDWEDGDDNQ